MSVRETSREVRGVSLYERRVGEGPEVVVLHGGPGAHHDYLLPGFDDLATARTLIYYDQRGGGRSPVPRDVPVGWQEQVADLDALREQWHLDRLTICGYSWGGLLAMLYAVTHPDRVAKLALVSPAPAWREARQQFEAEFSARNLDPELQAMRAQLRSSGLRESDPEAYQRRLFELSVLPYFADPELVHNLTPFRVTARTQQEVWDSLGNYDLRDPLSHLDVPAFVMQGEQDVIPWTASERVAELLGAEWHLVSRCGHCPHVEQRQRFREAVDGFLLRQ